MKLILSIILSVILLLQYNANAKEQHIYLSRHAEKMIDQKDPDLTDRGKSRALWLSFYLNSQSIEMIYTTNYRRTKQTVHPLASILKIQPTLYDPGKQEKFAVQVLADGRNSFISGHSNTIPELVKLLGGNHGLPITDQQYDRLYLLIVDESGKVTTKEMKSRLREN